MLCFSVMLTVWLTTQNHSTLVTERSAVPFLPVNPEYSATRNQVMLTQVCCNEPMGMQSTCRYKQAWIRQTFEGKSKKTKKKGRAALILWLHGERSSAVHKSRGLKIVCGLTMT